MSLLDSARTSRRQNKSAAALLVAAAIQAFFALPATADILKQAVATGPYPNYHAYNPVNKKLYVGSEGVRDVNGNIIIPGKVTIVSSNGDVATLNLDGCGVFGIAVNPTAKRLYASGCTDIFVINTDTNSVITTLPIDGEMAVNQTTNKLYVTKGAINPGNGTLHVVDGATNAVTTINFNDRPLRPIVNPATNKIYIPFNDTTTMKIVDGQTNAISTVPITHYVDLAMVNPATNRLYLHDSGRNDVQVFDGAANTLSDLVIAPPGGPGTQVMKLRTSNNTLYFGSTGGAIRIFDGVTHAQISTASTALGALTAYISGIDFNETTGKIYVSHASQGDVSGGPITNGMVVLDAVSNSVVQRLSAPFTSMGMYVDGSNNLAYTVGKQSGEVAVYDGKLDPVTQVTALPGGSNYSSGSMALNPVQNKVYVASRESNSVSVVDLATNTTSTINIGAPSYAAAFNAANGKVYVTAQNGSGNAVKVIESNGTISATIAVAQDPFVIKINPVTNKIYVANSGSKSVTIIDGTNNSATTTTVGHTPEAIGINKATNTIFVHNTIGQSISVISGATNSVIATIPSIAPLGDLFFSEFGVNETTNKIYLATTQKLYVIDGNSNTASLLDTRDITEDFPGRPIVVVDEGTNKAYATNHLGKITVIDGATNALSSIPLPSAQPYTVVSLAIDTTSKKLFVANLRDSTVTTVDLANNGIAVTGVDLGPSEAVYNAATRTVYVASNLKDTLSQVNDVVGQWTYQSGSNSYVYTFYANHTYQATLTIACPQPCTPVTDSHQGGYVLNKGRYALLPDFAPSRLGFTVNGNFLTGTDYGVPLPLQRTQ